MSALYERLSNKVTGALGSHQTLFTNASVVALGTLVSAGLGFVYWWLAARAFSPETVGIGSAAISIMGLCALMGEFGLGTLLVGEIPRRGGRSAGLVLASLITAFVLSAICGLATAVVALWLRPDFAGADSSVLLLALFVAGAAMNGLTLTLDQAFIGMLQGKLQMYRNAAFAFIKLVLLAIAAWLTARSGGPGAILASWIIGMFASVVTLMLLPNGHRWSAWAQPPDWPGLRLLARSSFDHHVLNLVTQAPGLLLPFLVVVMISAKVNAAFFAAWMLIGVALLMPASLTTVLFTVGRSDPGSLPERVKFSLKMSLLIGLAAGAGFFFLSHILLGLFSPLYPEIAGTSLKYLGFCVTGIAIKYHYIALKRLEDDMLWGSAVLGIGGAGELAFSALGAHLGGLSGLTLGLLIAVVLQAAWMLPPILRLAWPMQWPAKGRPTPAPSVSKTTAG